MKRKALLAMSDERYDVGYRDGENGAYQDWVVTINENTPLGDDFNITPDSTARLIAEMAALLAEIVEAFAEADRPSDVDHMEAPARALLARIQGEAE